MAKHGIKNQSALSNIYKKVPNACYGGNKKSSKPMVPGISPAKAMDPMYNGKPGVQKEDFKQFSSNAKYGIGGEGQYGMDAQQISSDKDVVASAKHSPAKKKGCGHTGKKKK